jgi:glycosyltransferase involved in cell wall biosynthesis
MAVCPVLADRVVFNSRFCLDVVTEVAPSLRRRSTVVYNAVRGPARPVPPRERLDGPLRLLFVGRLSPRKGPDVAVAVLRQLLDRGLDARLSVVGSVFEGYEWFETELRAAVAAGGLDDRVDFLGFQTAVWAHLDNADVVLVPSVLEESFGNAAVEAVLAARPVVVSDTSGLREAVAGYESAQSVVPGRPDLWADAVQRVAASWAWYGQAARRDAVVARERHAAARYRAELVGVVSALTARTADADTAPPLAATDALAG